MVRHLYHHGLKLQWGRGKKASEMGLIFRNPEISMRTSMGPRQKSLGNIRRSHGISHTMLTSMGPRQKSLGNTHHCVYLQSKLRTSMGPRQKSLGNSSVTREEFEAIIGLQWGRGKKASEIAAQIHNIVCYDATLYRLYVSSIFFIVTLNNKTQFRYII